MRLLGPVAAASASTILCVVICGRGLVAAAAALFPPFLCLPHLVCAVALLAVVPVVSRRAVLRLLLGVPVSARVFVPAAVVGWRTAARASPPGGGVCLVFVSLVVLLVARGVAVIV